MTVFLWGAGLTAAALVAAVVVAARHPRTSTFVDKALALIRQ